MLVDTHAHLDDPQFDPDRESVLERARAAGVQAIIAIGTTAASSRAATELAAAHPGVFASVGIHPNEAAGAAAGDWDEIVRLARLPRVVALGETGLDKHWTTTPFPLQQDYFQRHLELSQTTGLPVVIHTRDCLPDAIAMLQAARQRGPFKGVMHSYTGDLPSAELCLALGLYISFAGMVTFKKSHDLRAVAAAIPPESILVETDAPYLSPEPFRGKRNESGHVQHTARALAAARHTPFETFAAQTTANARRLFGLDGR